MRDIFAADDETYARSGSGQPLQFVVSLHTKIAELRDVHRYNMPEIGRFPFDIDWRQIVRAEVATEDMFRD